MNRTFFQNSMTIKEAAAYTETLKALPYNPSPDSLKEIREEEPEAFPPSKIFDNVYWIGTNIVGAILVDTKEGLLLIDTGSNSREAGIIADGIRSLGFAPEDIRLIVISHDHFDHYGGAGYFLSQICPSARLAMSQAGWNFLQTTPYEFAFIGPRPEKADILLTDNQKISLGNTVLACVFTPGHSPGCLSFIFNSSYLGKEIAVGVMGGSGCWPDMPEIRQYQNSVEYFRLYTEEAGCSAWVQIHQQKAELKKAADACAEESPSHPWITEEENFSAAYLQFFRSRAAEVLATGFVPPYARRVDPVRGIIPDE